MSTLALRRAALDDYDVIQDGEIVGRIYRMIADRELWCWMIRLAAAPRVRQSARGEGLPISAYL
jgi:hypothetical protein